MSYAGEGDICQYVSMHTAECGHAAIRYLTLGPTLSVFDMDLPLDLEPVVVVPPGSNKHNENADP